MSVAAAAVRRFLEFTRAQQMVSEGLHHRNSRIHKAIRRQDKEAVLKNLHSRGESLCSAEGSNCFVEAAVSTSSEFLAWLLELDPEGVRAVAEGGKTLLALCVGDTRKIKVLLERGADPLISCHLGLTPLMHALLHPQVTEDVVLNLIQGGSDLSTLTPEGDTCLTLLTKDERTHALNSLVQYGQLLIEAGADPKMEDAKKCTILSLVMRRLCDVGWTYRDDGFSLEELLQFIIYLFILPEWGEEVKFKCVPAMHPQTILLSDWFNLLAALDVAGVSQETVDRLINAVMRFKDIELVTELTSDDLPVSEWSQLLDPECPLPLGPISVLLWHAAGGPHTWQLTRGLRRVVSLGFSPRVPEQALSPLAVLASCCHLVRLKQRRPAIRFLCAQDEERATKGGQSNTEESTPAPKQEEGTAACMPDVHDELERAARSLLRGGARVKQRLVRLRDAERQRLCEQLDVPDALLIAVIAGNLRMVRLLLPYLGCPPWGILLLSGWRRGGTSPDLMAGAILPLVAEWGPMPPGSALYHQVSLHLADLAEFNKIPATTLQLFHDIHSNPPSLQLLCRASVRQLLSTVEGRQLLKTDDDGDHEHLTAELPDLLERHVPPGLGLRQFLQMAPSSPLGRCRCPSAEIAKTAALAAELNNYSWQ